MSTIIGDFDPTLVTWSPILTTPAIVDLSLGTAVPIYTVPSGKSFQMVNILIRGNTALTGSPSISVGTAGGLNSNILGTTSVTNTLDTGQAMAPILPAAVNALIGGASLINCLPVGVGISGSITVQFMGILF